MSEFQYFFSQREALETIIYLVDVVGMKDKFDLMRFDGSGAVSAGMFDETWRRFVIKMAHGQRQDQGPESGAGVEFRARDVAREPNGLETRLFWI